VFVENFDIDHNDTMYRYRVETEYLLGISTHH